MYHQYTGMHSNIQLDHKGPFGDGKTATSLGFCPTFTDLYRCKCPSRHFRSVITCILIWRDGGRECFPWRVTEIASTCVQCIHKTKEGFWSSKSKAKRRPWMTWVAVKQVTGRNTSRPHTVKKQTTGHLYISTLNSQDTLSPCIEDHIAKHINQHFKSPFFRDMFNVSLLLNPKESYRDWWLLRAKPGTFKLPMARKYLLLKDIPKNTFPLNRKIICWASSWEMLSGD